jgi:hypothetical protein
MKNTPKGVVRMCCTGLLFFFTRQCKDTHRMKNTPEGVVRKCCTGLLFSLPGSEGTLTALKTPKGVVRMCCTGLLFFFTRQCKNTHGIKNTPEGVVRMCCTGRLFTYQAVQGTHTAIKTHQRVL